MPAIDYRQLRRKISMAEVLALLGFQAASRQGDQLRGPCPIPGCRCPSQRSFSAHLTRQIYHCFACNSHGNPLDLWAAARQMPLHAAALELCQAAALVPPHLPPLHLISSPRQPRRVATRAPSRNHRPGSRRP